MSTESILTAASVSHLYVFSDASDPDDLWDFGTVRHALTLGKSKPNPVVPSDPPLTWEVNGTTRSDGSSASGHHSFSGGPLSKASSITAKGRVLIIP